jgi:hypothetical protein
LMICAARRAALTAMLSMGCMSLDPCAGAARLLTGNELKMNWISVETAQLKQHGTTAGQAFRRRRRIG